jgi:glyoxylase-like metal-dependent hydrolase (beta-lactamase superfamily II)
MKLQIIETGTFKLDGGAMFGVVPKKIWKSLVPPDENNLCTWSMRCLLVENGKQKILIDCGLGNKQDEKFFGHYEPSFMPTIDESLKKIGLTSDDITDVFLTHLHFDHCGGAIKKEGEKLLPAFQHATYWSNENHWKWATEPNAREKASFLKENILPIKESGLLKFVEVKDGIELFENFKIRFVNGHTEAMMIPEIKIGEHTICYMADLLPSAAHIPIPYVMGYDTRPLLTLQEKEHFLQEAFNKNFILFFEHDNANETCRLEKTDKGIKACDKGKLSDKI